MCLTKVGVLLATTWELIHPAKLEDLKGYARRDLHRVAGKATNASVSLESLP